MKIGIMGGGQLGWMLGLAGIPLGVRPLFVEGATHPPAAQVGPVWQGAYDAPELLERLAQATRIVTFEFENVPAGPLQALGDSVTVFPPPRVLETTQDRLHEKRLFAHLSIPTVEFAPVDSASDLPAALERVGLPAVLKTRRLGYDGKGQRRIERADDAASAWAALGGVPCVVEQRVALKRELSVIVTRAPDGQRRLYPLVQNTHHNGILHVSRAPARAPATTVEQAHQYAQNLVEAFDYVGVLALELFETEAGQLLANEIAPRVHNSGHWTLEGAETSQFENHLRAGLGWPLGDVSPRGHSLMLNCLGAMPAAASVLAVPGAHLYDYGKEPRPGRKVGHVTVRAEDETELAARGEQLAAALGMDAERVRALVNA